MGHYAKLATVALRVFGLMILLYAIPVIAFSLFTVVTAPSPSAQPPRNAVLAWVLYAALGALLFAFGRPLGRLAARGLDERPPAPPAA